MVRSRGMLSGVYDGNLRVPLLRRCYGKPKEGTDLLGSLNFDARDGDFNITWGPFWIFASQTYSAPHKGPFVPKLGCSMILFWL